ncbi:MAG: hypothetical protein LBQ40_04580, partial [Clostridiales bacterium]|nr:hypothetical protein [Clostridiales bacterium]
KEKNDWGKEIREDLLIKAPIKNSKKLPMSNRKLRNIFESKVEKYSGASYLTEDSYGRCIYYVLGRDSDGEHKSYTMMVSKDGSYDSENFLMEIDYMTDYREQLKEFKERNRWNLPPQ